MNEQLRQVRGQSKSKQDWRTRNAVARTAVVAVAIAFTAVPKADAIDLKASRDQQSEAAEARLRAGFDAAAEYAVLPARGRLVDGVALQGTWQSPGGYDSTSLTFQSSGQGSYSVQFSTAGCLGAWELSREATYEGSVVQLNLPVLEYLPGEYTRLYTISYRGEIHLIATARVEMFNEEWGEKSSYKHLLLTKVEPEEASNP